jgi:hypothetical protein
MVTKFPAFSKALSNDPTTRRLFFGIATVHDFELHDGITGVSLSKSFCFSFWSACSYFSLGFG